MDQTGEHLLTEWLEGSALWRVRTQLPPLTIEADPVFTLAAVPSPDGELVATVGLGGGIAITDRRTTTRLAWLATSELGDRDVAWAADGRSIVACGRDGQLRELDVVTGESLSSAQTEGIWTSATFIGETLYAVNTLGELVIREGGELRRTTMWQGGPRRIRPSPDGERLAVTCRDDCPQLTVLDRDGQLVYESGPVNQENTFGLAWHPDSDSLVIGDGGGSVLHWAGEELTEVHNVDGPLVAMTWSPDGRYLAVGSADGQVHFLDGELRERLVIEVSSASITDLRHSAHTLLLATGQDAHIFPLELYDASKTDLAVLARLPPGEAAERVARACMVRGDWACAVDGPRPLDSARAGLMLGREEALQHLEHLEGPLAELWQRWASHR